MVYEIEISKKPSLKIDFLHELLYSEQNKHLVEKIFDEQVDIGKLGRSLSSLFDEVYSVDFDQNEVIDSGEEETGVNLFSEFMDVALMWIEREADNDPYYWVEQYFDNNYGVDVQDYIESSTELNSRVIEFYISEYVESVLTTTQLEALDFEKLEDNLRDIFNYGVSDYIRAPLKTSQKTYKMR